MAFYVRAWRPALRCSHVSFAFVSSIPTVGARTGLRSFSMTISRSTTKQLLAGESSATKQFRFPKLYTTSAEPAPRLKSSSKPSAPKTKSNESVPPAVDKASEGSKRMRDLRALFNMIRSSMKGRGKGEPSVEDSSRVSLGRLVELLKPEKHWLGLAMGAQLISSLTVMAFPMAVGKIVDAVQSEEEEGRRNLKQIALYMFGLLLVGSAAVTVRVSTLNIVGERVAKSLRGKIFKSIMRQETGFFDRSQTGELVNRLSTDVVVVSKTMTENIARGLRSSVMTVGGIGFLVYLSPKLTFLTLAVIPTVIGGSLIYGRYVKQLSAGLQDRLAAATQVAAERISNIRTVRYFGAEAVETMRYRSAVDDAYELARNVAVANGFYNGAGFLTVQAALLGVLWFGGTMVLDHAISVGNLTSYAMYSVNVGVGITALSGAYGELMKSQGAGTRIFEVIDREPKKVSRLSAVIPSKPLDPTVEFRNVSFRYPARPEAEILHGLNLTVTPGECLAVCGSSGSGKSTISALISRLYDPSGGEVLVGGQNILDFDPRWWSSQIAVVEQQPTLFDGTIRENLLYGVYAAHIASKPQDTWLDLENHGSFDDIREEIAKVVSEEDMVAAAEAANAHAFITKFPDGYDTIVGEQGVGLSGGQRQRIALARALLKPNTRVLLLDEATSALDPLSESMVAFAIRRRLDHSKVPLSVVMIAHQLRSLRRADRIAVLDAGNIVQLGPYEELASVDGPFQRIMLAQTQSRPTAKPTEVKHVLQHDARKRHSAATHFDTEHGS